MKDSFCSFNRFWRTIFGPLTSFQGQFLFHYTYFVGQILFNWTILKGEFLHKFWQNIFFNISDEAFYNFHTYHSWLSVKSCDTLIQVLVTQSLKACTYIINTDCIVGYYFKPHELVQFKHAKFYIPTKKDWLMIPHTNVDWMSYEKYLEEIPLWKLKKNVRLQSR